MQENSGKPLLIPNEIRAKKILRQTFRIKRLKVQVDKIQKRKHELFQQAIDENFVPGSKVRIKFNSWVEKTKTIVEAEAFVHRVYPSIKYSDRLDENGERIPYIYFEYKFKQVKKDGAQSTRLFHYGISIGEKDIIRMELIQEPKTKNDE